MPDIQKRLCNEVARNLKAGDRPRIPAGGELLWHWFGDLHATRQVGYSGPMSITFMEIEAYARLNRLPIEPRHVAILRAMDRSFLEALDKTAPPPGVKAAPRVSDRVISTAMFDAIF